VLLFHPADAEDDHTAAERQALGSELEALERNLRAKEEYMRQIATGGHQMVALKQHYDEKMGQMETEIETIQREKLELSAKLAALHEAKGDSKQIGQYRSKLKALEAKLGGLQKKLAANARLERLKTQSEEAAKRLTVDIHDMKRARVEMLKKMEKLSKEAAEHRRVQEKALLQVGSPPVSPTVSPTVSLPSRTVSPCVSHRVSLTVSLSLCLSHCLPLSPTVSPTVSPTLSPSLCLPPCLPHCVPPTVSPTVSPSPSLSPSPSCCRRHARSARPPCSWPRPPT
jgi:hypothetical protein